MPGIDDDALYPHELTAVTTVADADVFILEQAADQNVGKKITFANLLTEISDGIPGISDVSLFQYVGTFNPNAGGIAYTYDGSNRILTITYSTSPVGVITYSYNIDNTVDYVTGEFTVPVVINLKNQYTYTGGKITGIVRTIY